MKQLYKVCVGCGGHMLPAPHSQVCRRVPLTQVGAAEVKVVSDENISKFSSD